MSERLAGSLGREHARGGLTQELLTRRGFLGKVAAGLGAAAAGAFGVKELVVPRIVEEYSRYRSIGGDYSNWSFFEATGARVIDRTRLDELLIDDTVTPAILYGIAQESQINPEALAEYVLELDRDGPVFAEFDGLYDDSVSLTVLRAVVDDEEEFLVPLVRDDAEQPPVTIQLGTLSEGHHKIELFEEYSGVPVTADEVTFRVSQGEAGTLRSFIDAHQPDIYLRDYGNIANNFPRRSYAAILETDSHIAVVYITECSDEDQVFGLFGTSVQQLIDTKNRPTDIDWGVEMLIDKEDGSMEQANVAEPYHSRKKVSVDRGNQAERLSVRIDSANNNLQVIGAGSSTLDRPKVRFSPIILTYEEMKAAVRGTDLATARLSLCENYEEDRIDPDNQTDAAILASYDLDVDDCTN